MKLTQTQLKLIFTSNKVVFFGRVEKLNSKELLILKKKLFKKEINVRFISNKDLKRFLSNYKNKSIYNLFKGETILLFSKKLDWSKFYNVCKISFSEISFYCLYSYNRFFFLANLIVLNKNLDVFRFLRHRLYNDLLKIIFLVNHRLSKLLIIQTLSILNILEKQKNDN